MPSLELHSVLAALEATSPPSEEETAEHPLEAELRRAVAGLPPEAREQIQVRVREAEQQLLPVIADALRTIAELSKDTTVVRLVAESLKPSRVGELTPSHDALTAAFARGTAKAIEASRSAGLPVHAMVDGKIAKVSPHDK